MTRGMDKMRLAFFTDVHPYPPDHGSSVISRAWVLGMLRRGHEAAVCARYASSTEINADQAWEGLDVLDVTAPVRVPAGERVRMLVSGSPIPVARTGCSWVRAGLGRMREQCFTPDAVVCVGPSLAGAVVELKRHMPDVPVVFVPYDSVVRVLRSRREHLRGVERVWNRLQEGRWASVERRLYPQADACVAVTREDAAAMRAGWNEDEGRVHVFPNGVDGSYFDGGAEAVEPRSVVVSGNMYSMETVQSVLWFLGSAWPLVLDRVPDATCTLVGQNPAAELREIASRTPGVRVTGRVPDIRPYLAQAAVYVSPLRMGSGIKNRMLEALAMGKAIVATPASVYGLSLERGVHFLVGETTQDMADHIVRLLQDKDERQRLERNAFTGVRTQHSWDRAAERLEVLIRNLSNTSRSLTTANAGGRA